MKRKLNGAVEGALSSIIFIIIAVVAYILEADHTIVCGFLGVAIGGNITCIRLIYKQNKDIK